MRQLHFDDLGAAPGCADVHVTRLQGARVSEPHTHDFYEAFLVLEGEGIHHLNRRRLPLQTGHLVVVRPADAHWYSTASGRYLVFVNVAVSASWWQAFHTLLGLEARAEERRTVYLGHADTRRLGAELSATALTKNPVAVLRAWSLIRAHRLAPTGQKTQMPPFWLESLRRKLTAMPENLAEPISFWQRLAGRTPEHLARSSRRFYGVTFSELINQARIDRARYLLRASDEKVIAIAYDCGFQNLANFYRVFARLTGRTPSQWRGERTGAVPIDLGPPAAPQTPR